MLSLFCGLDTNNCAQCKNIPCDYGVKACSIKQTADNYAMSGFREAEDESFLTDLRGSRHD